MWTQAVGTTSTSSGRELRRLPCQRMTKREGERVDRVRISPMGADTPTSHVAGSPSDDELLAAARQGDTAALETLLVRYQPHLYRFGLRMCGNVEDAGDVAQESLISMSDGGSGGPGWQRGREFGGTVNFSGPALNFRSAG